MAVKTYRDLLVWQRGIDLVEQVYLVSRQFPREEMFGLTSQVRRAAVSVPSNIAEGQGRGIGNEFAYHVRVSQGSLQEVETQLIVAERMEMAKPSAIRRAMELADEVGRLNRGLLKPIRC